MNAKTSQFSLRCWLGIHRERLAQEFTGASRRTLGVRCARCGERRLSIGGDRPQAPPLKNSPAAIADQTAYRLAQAWALEGTPSGRAVAPVWWR